MHRPAPLFEISTSAAARIIDQLGRMAAQRPRQRFRKDIMLIAHETLAPTRDHPVTEQSKNYRYCTACQVVTDADTRLAGQPVPGNRHNSRHCEESGARAAVGQTRTITDGGYQGTGPLIPHHRRKDDGPPAWKEEHQRARTRAERPCVRTKSWKTPRDCLKGDRVDHPMLGNAHLHNLTSPDRRTSRTAVDRVSNNSKIIYGTTLSCPAADGRTEYAVPPAGLERFSPSGSEVLLIVCWALVSAELRVRIGR